MSYVYSPVALIVDDDAAVVSRARRNFLGDTSVGVLAATDLGTAARFIEDSSLQIDLIVSDINFPSPTQAPQRDLRDGFDLLRFAQSKRPGTLLYVLSVEADEPHAPWRAQQAGIAISGWFQKLNAATGKKSLWRIIEEDFRRTVEKDFVMKAVKRYSELRRELKDLGVSVPDGLNDKTLARSIRKKLIFERRTYLQELPHPFEVIKPIEVLCRKTTDGSFAASAPQIGILTSGHATNVSEALDDLSDMLVSEMQRLTKDEHLIGHAGHLHAKLGEFIRTQTEQGSP